MEIEKDSDGFKEESCACLSITRKETATLYSGPA
jgi:hypothetical protein